MKRTAWVRIVCVVGVCCGGAVAFGAQQLVKNGSMEEGGGPDGPDDRVPAGWDLDLSGLGVMQRNAETNAFPLLPPGEGHALKCYGNQDREATQDVPVNAGDEVTASALLLKEGDDLIGGGARAGIALEFYDGISAIPLDSVEVYPLDESTNATIWIPASLTLTAPSGTTTARIACKWDGNASAAGAGFWDEASLTINGGANQLVNPEFEDVGTSGMAPNGITHWTGFEAAEKSNDVAFDGASSVKVLAQDSGGGSFNGLFQPLNFTAIAGDRIVVKARALNPSSDPLTLNAVGGLKLEFSQPEDTPVGLPGPTENLAITSDADTDAWIYVDLNSNALAIPNDAKFARVVMIYQVDNPNAYTNGEVWFDSASATIGGGGNLLQNSSFESGPGGQNGITSWTEFGFRPFSKTEKFVPLDGDFNFLAHNGAVVAQSQGQLTTGVTQDVNVEGHGGEIFQASAYLRVPKSGKFSPEAGIRCGVKVEWKGGSAPGNVDVGAPGYNNTITKNDDKDVWKELTIDYTMPLGSRANLTVTNLVGFAGGGTVYFDGLEAVIYEAFSGVDADGSNTMDLYDYSLMQKCFSGDGVLYDGWPCTVFDQDEDGDVDLADWAAFDPGANMTGPVAP